MIQAYLGIDISKSTFDVTLLTADGKAKHKAFSNIEQGFACLEAWLGQQLLTAPSDLHACLEATAKYGDALARHLHQKGFLVSIVNPAAVRAFARSELSRTKTDKADSGRIARFCRAHQPAVWTPPAPEIVALSALVHRLEMLKQMQQREQNRLEGAAEPVKGSVEAVLSTLAEQIRKTEQLIREHIDQHAGLKEQAVLLESIPGIGPATTAILLCELGEVRRFRSARQVVAFAGLCPRLCESGSSVRGRNPLSKLGRSRLRRALYFPAMNALRFNPVLHALRERLKERGKRPMVILGAAMRKLLHLAFGVLKSKKPFDPAIACPAYP
jgi:transposase